MALILALAWLPMVHACDLAHAAGFELPDHEARGQSGEMPSDHCDHCMFCETVDSGAVMAAVAARIPVPAFVALLPLWQPLMAPPMAAPPKFVAVMAHGDHDRPPQRWRFSERTALPARAPSLAA